MMIRPSDIHTLDNFRRKTRQHVERLQSTGRPQVLTVNGKPSVVVQDAIAYETEIEKLEVLKALAESVRQSDRGDLTDARKSVQKLLHELSHR